MCGIFGYAGYKNNAPKLVIDGLKSLEYRGYDSWGVALLTEKKEKNEKPEKREKLIIKKRTGKITEAAIPELPPSNFSFGHTRWATHGGVTEKNAHPFIDCTGTIALIHNGIIENYHQLKGKLLAKGHKFVSDTDSEVAVHLVEEYAKTMIVSKAVQKAFNEIEGLNALVVLHAGEKRMIAVRNGSPIVVGYGDGENFIASDAIALLPYTKQVHFLEDNQMAIVSAKGIMIFNARTGDEIKPLKHTLDWTVEQTVKGKYPYFMLKEIHEQTGVIADIAANYQEQAAKMADLVKRSSETYLIGCGTAAYACLAGTYIFSKVAHHHVNSSLASEFAYKLEFLTEKSLVIALSQSGETMDTLEAVRKAKEKQATVAAYVNMLGSSLYRAADQKILIGAGPETGVASTKAFTAKLAHLILLAHAISGTVADGQMELTKAVRSTQKILSDKSQFAIQHLARQMKHVGHLYVIGRGLSHPAALEAALKIKEVSYIHAEGIAAGELKHGPLALVGKGTYCIAFLPNDETYGANLAGAMEMKARGAHIIGVSFKPHDIFDTYIEIADAEEATIIPNVVFGQLLAYYLAVERGLNPDKPRNLAKSVTVK